MRAGVLQFDAALVESDAEPGDYAVTEFVGCSSVGPSVVGDAGEIAADATAEQDGAEHQMAFPLM